MTEQTTGFRIFNDPRIKKLNDDYMKESVPNSDPSFPSKQFISGQSSIVQ